MVQRKHAFLIHLAVSSLVLAAFAAWVLTALYPSPLLQLQGGTNILTMVVFVDLVLGPALTLIVYKPGKKTLLFDMAVIVAIQVVALGYGMFAIHSQRPLFLAFTLDRFMVVTAGDLLPGNVPDDVLSQSAWHGNIRVVRVKLPPTIELMGQQSTIDTESYKTLSLAPSTYVPFVGLSEATKSRAITSKSDASGQKVLGFPVIGRVANGTVYVTLNGELVAVEPQGDKN
jgi:hypothetical protein